MERIERNNVAHNIVTQKFPRAEKRLILATSNLKRIKYDHFWNGMKSEWVSNHDDILKLINKTTVQPDFINNELLM